MTESAPKPVLKNGPDPPATATNFPAEMHTRVAEGWPHWWSGTTLGNYTGVIRKASSSVLDLELLEPLQRKYTSEYCSKAFDSHWRSSRETDPNMSHQSVGDTRSETTSGTTEEASRQKPVRERAIIRALVKAFREFILLSSILEIAFDIVRLLPVFILSKLISFVDSSETLATGCWYCFLLLANNVALALLVHWMDFTCYSGGAQIRSALLGAIYHKCLLVSSESSRRFTAGDVLNLISVDVDNILEFTQTCTMIWGGVLRILSSIFVIWFYLGPSCLAGLFVIIAFVPLTVCLSNATRGYQDLQSKEKDRRLSTLNEIFSGIKIIKLFAWEIPFIRKAEDIRNTEVHWIRKYLYGEAAISFVWYCSPFLVTAAAFGVYVYISKENILTPEKAFISLYLFNNMRYSLTFLPLNVTMLLKALVSLRRIENYLKMDEISPVTSSTQLSHGEDIRFKDVSLAWSGATPILSELNLSVGAGELLAVVGPVGGGKSSLLSAILGEMKKLSGSLEVRRTGRIAFVTQQAWIQNETVRQNVLFTSTLERRWYKEVIKKCCMESDIRLLPGGDLTEIGEKGANLSGGQKQRISLARAVYQKAAIYLLDDPLSAVDACVSTRLFEDVIGPNGLLKNTTRVLVTHSVNVLPYVDRIVVLSGGRITHIGTLKELLDTDIPIKAFLVDPKLDHGEFLKGGGLRSAGLRGESSTVSSFSLNATHDILIAGENVAVGGIEWTVYASFCKHFGLITGFFTLAGFVLYRISDTYSTVFLSAWSEDSRSIMENHSIEVLDISPVPPEVLEEIREKSLERVKVYLYLGGGQALGVIVAAFCLATGCLAASSNLHSSMLWSLMRAPMRFFEATPLGRIMNRFGKDVNVIDIELFLQLDEWLDAGTQVIATIILVAIQLPVFLAVMFPLSAVFLSIQRVYIGAARQFRRLLSSTRSPVMNNFVETMNGVSTIRAYGAGEYFVEKSRLRIDLNQNCYFHSMVTTRWASLRIDLVSAIATGLIGFLVVLYRDGLSEGTAGMILSYSLLVCDAASCMIRVAIEVEKCVVAAERIGEYTDVESEAPWTVDDGPQLDKNWPTRGEITLENYSTKYREGADFVLKNVSLKIHSGEKVGIVGRTGAGKSSLTLAIFRIVEAAGGRIVIDNVDTSKLGLHDLRGRLTMLPQEPIVFKGTIRSNLDPHNIYSDGAVWSALERAHLKSNMLQLHFEVSEAGNNLSVGERQLICLARALLRKTKIIVLDEATAAVDRGTDALIQETIRRDFSECTVLTIAHRLHTVVDYDTIVVLSEGAVVEVGQPRELLKDEKSRFYSMAKDAGLI